MMLERARHDVMMCRIAFKLMGTWSYGLETRTYTQLSKFHDDLAKINDDVDKFARHYFNNWNWDELSAKEKEALMNEREVVE